MNEGSAHRIWRGFCDRFQISKECVPLFELAPSGCVAKKMIGRGTSARQVLARSSEMESMVLREVAKLEEDWTAKRHKLDGLIYVLGIKHLDGYIPLYVGKAETLGKGDGNLSANLKNIRTDRSKFARWGDNYAYHVGDLSACVLPGHAPDKQTTKYQAWADLLFETLGEQPRLKEPIYFWARAWNPAHVGIWEEMGPTSLAFLEYMLIGVAGRVSPNLLNREGIGREIGRT
ncbi:MAG: hypothetical protein WCK81_15155 [Betaproteobacteria bacterium]